MRNESDAPGIGVTAGSAAAWAESGEHFLPYAAAISAAGGRPVRLGPEDDDTEDRLAGLDGLLLTGGPDLDLREYPNPSPLSENEIVALMAERRMTMERPRDRAEMALVRQAVRSGRPVLGICRGCQVLHVSLGGQLILDLPSERPEARVHTSAGSTADRSTRHVVEIVPGTLLAAALEGDGRFEANSRHHQAIASPLPPGAFASALCPEDGVIEAIEAPGCGWVIGVQWHPERPADADVRDRFRRLFDAFVNACRRRSWRR